MFFGKQNAERPTPLTVSGSQRAIQNPKPFSGIDRQFNRRLWILMTCIFCDQAELWIDKVMIFSCGRSSVPIFKDQEGLGFEFVLSVTCLQLNTAAKTIINIYFQINKKAVIKWIRSYLRFGVISGPLRTFPNEFMKDNFTVGVSATRGEQFCKSYLNQAE